MLSSTYGKMQVHDLFNCSIFLKAVNLSWNMAYIQIQGKKNIRLSSLQEKESSVPKNILAIVLKHFFCV